MITFTYYETIIKRTENINQIDKKERAHLKVTTLSLSLLRKMRLTQITFENCPYKFDVS